MNIADAAQITRPPSARKPRVGAHAITLDVRGVDVDVTYDWSGAYLLATDCDPAEYPYPELVTATVGGVDVTPWDDALGISDALDEEVAGDA